MGRNGFGNGTKAAGFLARSRHGLRGDVVARDVTREEPRVRSFHSPPVAQDLEQFGREHHVAILVTLALIDANHHSLTIDVGCGEAGASEMRRPVA